MLAVSLCDETPMFCEVCIARRDVGVVSSYIEERAIEGDEPQISTER